MVLFIRSNVVIRSKQLITTSLDNIKIKYINNNNKSYSFSENIVSIKVRK